MINLLRDAEAWSAHECSQLELRFKAGMSAFAIAEAHGRRIAGVLAKLDAVRLVHFRRLAWYNSITGAVWLPIREKQQREFEERTQIARHAGSTGDATGPCE